MKFLLYCAIRRSDLINQFIYSIMSVSMVINIENYIIVIVTDMVKQLKAELKCLPESLIKQIKIESISPQMVAKWIGNSGYIFRVKIKALQYFFEIYQSDVFFIDCDMYPKKNFEILIDQIKTNRFVMFARYQNSLSTIIQNDYPHIYKALEDFLSVDKKSLKIDHYGRIYKIFTKNHPVLSSVIGMKFQHATLIEEVLDLCDLLFLKTNIYTCEEIAFMLAFERVGSISLADNYFGTCRSINWIRLLLAYCCNTFTDGDKEKYQALVKNIPLSIFHDTDWTYSYDNFRFLTSIYLAFMKQQSIPDFPTVCAAGIEYGFVRSNRIDLICMHNLYKKYLSAK